MNRYAAEFLATFMLVFAGAGAIVVDVFSGGAITHLGISLTFGLIVLAMIYAVGDISGAHINPAVTIGFWAARRFAGRDVLPYIVSQVLGALAASGLLRLMFPESTTFGETLPAGPVMQSFVLEIVLTFILMFVILCVSTGSKETGILAGVAVGAVIALEATFGGPVSGASMNPARSLGPAVAAMKFEHLWIYLTAPVIGAVVSIVAWRVVRSGGGGAQDESDAG